jgi:peroxiredoxin
VDLDAFAMFPRSFVIDRQGRIAYASAQMDTGGLIDAIEAVLAE